MAVPRADLLSIAEGRKMARVISLSCFEGGTIDRPGERVWTSLRICQGTLCCSCISFNMKGNWKVHWARAVAKTGSALFISRMGQLHQWSYKNFALLWMASSCHPHVTGKKWGVLLGLQCCGVYFSLSASHCGSVCPVELQWSIRTENLDWSVYSVTVIMCSFLCPFFFFNNYYFFFRRLKIR